LVVTRDVPRIFHAVNVQPTATPILDSWSGQCCRGRLVQRAMWVVMDQVSYQFQPRSLAGYVKCYEMLYELQIDTWRSELRSTPPKFPWNFGNIVELTHLEGQQLEALPYAPQLPV
jgi:hypothetical protein